MNATIKQADHIGQFIENLLKLPAATPRQVKLSESKKSLASLKKMHKEEYRKSLRRQGIEKMDNDHSYEEPYYGGYISYDGMNIN
jgi:hypothetical protein